MKRGDVVTVAAAGDYGKPRPALVIQSDFFNPTHASVTLLPLSSTVIDAPMFRVTVDPSPANGLQKVSQVMVDKIITVRTERVSKTIGRLDEDALVRVTRALSVWVGLA